MVDNRMEWTIKAIHGTKYVHFESVTISQDGIEVSISSHIIRENQLKKKLKSDRLLYKATALDVSAYTSAEQPIIGGSHSSEGKGMEKVLLEQEGGAGHVVRQNITDRKLEIKEDAPADISLPKSSETKPSSETAAAKKESREGREGGKGRARGKGGCTEGRSFGGARLSRKRRQATTRRTGL